MKRIFLTLISLFLLASIIYPQEKWFNLYEDQIYFADFELLAGDTTKAAIDSKDELWVGFNSNTTIEQNEKYMKSGSYPVTLVQEDTDAEISSTFGGAIPFKPVAGRIELLVINKSEESFKIVIYTKEKE